MLFEDTPKALTEKIELIVRLMRSKGDDYKAFGSAATSIGRSIGTQIVRGILGAIFKR